MREITEHRVNPTNDRLIIRVKDEPGPGGAHHCYSIGGFETGPYVLVGMTPDQSWIDLCFQNGPIPDAGVNGITQEALLAIVADRLRSFQTGPYACDENQRALDAVVVAQEALHSRTRARMARGVEGTHTV